MAVLTWKGATAKEALASEVIANVPNWVQQEKLPPNAVPGAKLFATAGCTACHTYLGTGVLEPRRAGPDRDRLAQPRRRLPDPPPQVPVVRQPGLADAEVRVARGEAPAPAGDLPRGLEGQAVAGRAPPRNRQTSGGCTSSSASPAPPAPLRGAPARGARRRRLRDRRLRLERRDRGARDRALRRRRAARARRRSRACSSGRGGAATVYEPDDWKAPYASGSAQVDAYVLCPCSMGTLGTLASGAMQNLIHRAASVALKEERRLVLMPRETPLSAIHLRNMLTLREAGATILFLAPGFYHGAETRRRPRRLRRRPRARPARARERAHPALGAGLSGRDGRLPARGRPADVRPDRAGLRPDEPRDDRGARPALARRRPSRRRCGPATASSTPAAAPATSRSPRGAPARARSSGSTSPSGCSSARGAKAPELEWVQGDVLALPFPDASFDAATVGFGVRNVEDLEAGLRELRRVLRPGGRLGDPRDHDAARPARAVLPRLVRPRHPAARTRAPRRRGVHVPAGERPPLPRAGGARRPARAERLRATCGSGALQGVSWPCTSGRQPEGRQPGEHDHGRDPGGARARGLSRRARGAARADRRQPSGPRRGGRQRGARRRRQAAAPRARLPLDAAGPGAVARRGRRRRARAHGDARPRRPDRPRPLPPRQGRRLVGLRPGRRPRDRRLPVRARLRRAERDRRRRRGRDPRRRDPLPRPRRGAAADADPRSGDDRRRLPRALRAQDREAVRGRVRARRRLRRVRARARDRVPDRRRRARLLGRDDRDRQDRRHRPPRRHADAAAAARRAAGRRRARGARGRAARRRTRPRRRHRRVGAVHARSPSTTLRGPGRASTGSSTATSSRR